jgi:hypothetical protein
LNSTPSSGWDAYEAAFRADVHQLLAWGYADARVHLSASSSEEEITGHIVSAMEARLDAPDTAPRFDRYEICENNPLPGENRTGHRRRRADIRVRTNVRRPRPRYVFEAKRLRSPGFGMSKYVGRDGLKRFVSATSYSSYSDYMSMVGYVQSHTPGHWVQKLRDVLTSQGSADLRCKGELHRDPALSCVDHCYLTTHCVDDAFSFQITHVFLDCT